VRIDHHHGRLDILVNDIFDSGRQAQFGTTAGSMIWSEAATAPVA
jgi:hypothetical protein